MFETRTGRAFVSQTFIIIVPMLANFSSPTMRFRSFHLAIFNGGTIENERNKIKKLNDIKLVSSI